MGLVDGRRGWGREANVSVMNALEDRERMQLRSPVLRGVELHTATWRGVQPSPVLLSQLALMLCDAGGCEVGWGRQQQSLGAGAVLVRAPNQVSVQMQRALPETACRVVLVEPDLLPGAASVETRRMLRFGSLVTRAPAVIDGLRAMWDAVMDDAPGIEQQSRLASLM